MYSSTPMSLSHPIGRKIFLDFFPGCEVKIYQPSYDLKEKFQPKIQSKARVQEAFINKVFAHFYVSLNGRDGHKMINSQVNLAQVKDLLASYEWVLPFKIRSESSSE